MLNRGHVELAIQKLNRLLEAPLEVGDQQISVRVTAGAALCPDACQPCRIPVAQGRDRAGHRAARACRISRPGDDAENDTLSLSAQWELEVELGAAIDRGELQMHYQPQVGPPQQPSARRRGADALGTLRTQGTISPEVFIPLAEHTGKIKKITIWALNTALRRAGEWRSDLGPLTISLNLPGELAMPARPARTGRERAAAVGQAARAPDAGNHRAFADGRAARTRHPATLARHWGCRVSIDDFGTGYSCLAYFKDLPVDELKIDKSFVTGLLDDRASMDITALIIDLAHRFELQVVAEGVENPRVMQVLRKLGCNAAQGYLFGKAMPAEAFQHWLLEYNPQPTPARPSASPRPAAS